MMAQKARIVGLRFKRSGASGFRGRVLWPWAWRHSCGVPLAIEFDAPTVSSGTAAGVRGFGQATRWQGTVTKTAGYLKTVGDGLAALCARN